jgi:beta-lactam-binding protein with PASTA domain
VSSDETTGWPRRDRDVDEETRALPPPAPERRTRTTSVRDEAGIPPLPVPPDGPGAADRLGWELLVGLVALALFGGLVAAWLLSRHHRHGATGATTTVVVTTAGAPSGTRVGVVVPSLVGGARGDAQSALRGAGLRPSVHVVRNAAPAGTVLAQRPAPGARIARGGAVVLDVSAGPPAATTTTTTTAPPPPKPPATVPDLAGEVKPAVQKLAGQGLLASIQYVPGKATLGVVTAQSPQSGTTAPAGSHVTLSVSSGPGRNLQETVPDVAGKRVPDALRTLNAAGLRLILLRRTVADQAQAGTIVEQTPQPGAHAPRNAQVLVYMGAYRGPS